MKTTTLRVGRSLPVLAIFWASSVSVAGEFQVTSDFSGGSGKVISIDQQKRRVAIQPTSHPGRGWECWWNVRIDGLTPGETIEVEVGPSPWATPNQAAVSTDGRTWVQSAIGRRAGKRITYTVPVRSNKLHIAWGPPFSIEHAKALVDRAGAEDRVTAFELCRTRRGRPVWAIHFQPKKKTRKSDRVGIWIQARQHAWEAGSSWVCQGLVEWLLDESENARWLRERADIYVVPVMDVDNVAIGAGGKNQQPQDHNRDWSEKPHWPSVRAAQSRIKQMSADGAFHVFVDLHNPGASARFPYFYVPPEETLTLLEQRNQVAFLQAVRINMSEPLPFKGETQPSGAGYDANWRRISKNWVAANTRDGAVSVTLETAWNTPHSHPTGYRAVGGQLAGGIADYLKITDGDRRASIGQDGK